MERKVYLQPTKLSDVISVKELFCIHSYWYPPTFHFEGESHEAMELVYVQTGSTVVTTNSYSVILNQDDLIIHKPWDFHKIRANNTFCRMFIFSFSLTKSSAAKEITDRIYTANDIDKFLISNILHKGINLVAGKNGKPVTNTPPRFSDSQIVKNSLELLLINIANEKINETPSAPTERITPVSPVVSDIIDYLEKHIYEKITLEDLAKNVGYSIPRISSVFKKEIGDSVIHYLINKRMQKACELITEGEKSIKDISEMLSFETVQYFSSQFKKIIGLTPAQFRDKIRTDFSYLEINFEKTRNPEPEKTAEK